MLPALALAAVASFSGPATWSVPFGTLEEWPGGRPGVVVAAPHEGFDLGTSVVASAAVSVLGTGIVVADDIREPDHPINVNRPTEGIWLPPGRERFTARARAVFDDYMQALHRAAQGPIWLLIEIHGNSRKQSARAAEVATKGLSEASARVLKRDLERALAPLGVKVQPLDRIYFGADGARRDGSLSEVPEAIHIELPRAERRRGRRWKVGTEIGRAIARWLASGGAGAN